MIWKLEKKLFLEKTTTQSYGAFVVKVDPRDRIPHLPSFTNHNNINSFSSL